MNFEPENNSPSPPTTPAASQLEKDFQRGFAFCQQKNWAQAKACFEAVVAQDPAHVVAWNNLGNVLDELGDELGADRAYATALQQAPHYASAQKNRAIVAHKRGVRVYEQGDLSQALHCFALAAQLVQNNASYDHSFLQLLLETGQHAPQHAQLATMYGRWQAHDSYVLHPYPLLAASDDALWHRQVAQRHQASLTHQASQAPPRSSPKESPRWHELPPKGERIRVAYLSADWHQHPVPQQLIPCLEAHDRSRFELIGIATDTRPDTSPWRQRIESAFGVFLPLGDWTDTQIAQQLRHLQVDIAIDLSLYMDGGRPLILASRPAPVQAVFLGYPGSSCAPWIDYLLADEVTIPQASEAYYSEKIMRLPRSFMPDHAQRPPVLPVANKASARMAQGLPSDALVLCAFSNPYKITPAVLDVWFKALQRIPGSVLWLQANNDLALQHITQAAVQANLDPKRLVWARRVQDFAQHVQRYALADLFLDTFPYNAHVTAADVLWAGLPLLTLQGQSFASRVASSILTALDLPELISTDLHSYEERIVELANHPSQLQALREKLAASKAAGLYFQHETYARALEGAYQTMKAQPQPWPKDGAIKPAHARQKKLISFSLWGAEPKYLVGALRNAQLAQSLYPGWVCRFYCANDLPADYLKKLSDYTHVEIVLMSPKPGRAGAFWRFLALEDAGVSHVLFRDTDSRLSQREVAAVQEWLASDKTVHLMRDHPFHEPAIMAGMWGCQTGVITGMQALIDSLPDEQQQTYGDDQTVLANKVYPQVKHLCLIHDSVQLSHAGLDVRPFPTVRQGLDFVGQCFDERDQPNLYYAQELQATLSRL